MNVTLPSDFSDSDAGGKKVNYQLTEKELCKGDMKVLPPPNSVMAKFKGVVAICGSCGRTLGKFVHADGVVHCWHKDCKEVNVIKK